MRILPYSDSESTRTLEVFQPSPDLLYSLELTAHLAGVTRRSILIYCRLGVVQPILLPPFGVMVFTEETIHRVRRIEQIRTAHQLDVTWIKTIWDLREEVEQLRAELRFWRRS